MNPHFRNFSHGFETWWMSWVVERISRLDFGSGPDADPVCQWITNRKLFSLAEVKYALSWMSFCLFLPLTCCRSTRYLLCYCWGSTFEMCTHWSDSCWTPPALVAWLHPTWPTPPNLVFLVGRRHQACKALLIIHCPQARAKLVIGPGQMGNVGPHFKLLIKYFVIIAKYIWLTLFKCRAIGLTQSILADHLVFDILCSETGRCSFSISHHWGLKLKTLNIFCMVGPCQLAHLTPPLFWPAPSPQGTDPWGFVHAISSKCW